jgi:hypothetical protein
MAPNKVAVMIDLVAMQANGDSNMDINTGYIFFMDMGMCYSWWAFLEL